MASYSQVLLLPLDVDAAASVCRQVLRGIGWTAEEDGESLLATEDGSRLHCHCHPATVHVTFRSRGDRTETSFEGSVAGWGPISSKHVREQTSGLARRVGLASIERATAPVA